MFVLIQQKKGINKLRYVGEYQKEIKSRIVKKNFFFFLKTKSIHRRVVVIERTNAYTYTSKFKITTPPPSPNEIFIEEEEIMAKELWLHSQNSTSFFGVLAFEEERRAGVLSLSKI